MRFLLIVILLTSIASYSMATEHIKLCTGATSGVYHLAGSELSKAVDKSFLSVELKPTRGSWQNMKLVAAGDCQAAIVQADAYTLYAKQNPAKASSIDRVGGVYQEYTHMICNRRSGVSDASDLESGKYTLAVGKPGSGGWVTINNWISEDEDYKNVPTVPLGGIIAAAKVADGSDVQCMLLNSGLNSGFIHKIDSRFGDKLILVSATDSDFNDATDPKGSQLYTFSDIPARTYKQHLQTGIFSGVETIKQDAVLIINLLYFEEHIEAYEALLEAYSVSHSKLQSMSI